MATVEAMGPITARAVDGRRWRRARSTQHAARRLLSMASQRERHGVRLAPGNVSYESCCMEIGKTHVDRSVGSRTCSEKNRGVRRAHIHGLGQPDAQRECLPARPACFSVVLAAELGDAIAAALIGGASCCDARAIAGRHLVQHAGCDAAATLCWQPSGYRRMRRFSATASLFIVFNLLMFLTLSWHEAGESDERLLSLRATPGADVMTDAEALAA